MTRGGAERGPGRAADRGPPRSLPKRPEHRGAEAVTATVAWYDAAVSDAVWRKTYCRICTAYCAVEANVVGGRVTAVRGDAGDPVSGGYTCSKGRALPHQLHGPRRLHRSLRRAADGGFEPIATARALDEIATRLDAIRARHGGRAIATYCGTGAFANAGLVAVARAWLRGLGSPMSFSTLTIDQPAKMLAAARHGVWGAGGHTFAEADVVLSVGNNPIVSGLTLPGGPPGPNPVHALREARRRGTKLIVVDPRRSELAKRADLYLQVRPGEDPTLLAGMIRVILDERLNDQAFCAAYTQGLDALAAAVRSFDLAYVEARTGVPATLVADAARLFARGPRGYASSGTGPDMAPHPSLTEHLLASLNTLCGRHRRAGEGIPNPGVLFPPLPRPAQPIPHELLPPILSLDGPPSRVRDLHGMFEEMPTTTLADEILAPGDGRVRALVCVGGNPAVAVPDQARMLRALEALDLLVSVDLTLTATARRSHYAVAARHPLEREDVTDFMDMFYEVPYAFWAHPVVAPEADAVDDVDVFAGLARRMGTAIDLPGGRVDVAGAPTKLDVMRLVRPATRVPLERLYALGRGRVFDEIRVDAADAIPGLDARLDFAPEGIPEELAQVRAEPIRVPGVDGFTHLLVCRRLRHVANSVGHDFPRSTPGAANPAYLNPADLARLGLAPGAAVTICSDHAVIESVAEPDADVPPGVLSMAHCFGAAPTSAAPPDGNPNTARLVAVDRDYDPHTGMARQSAIPVTVRPATPPA